MAKRAVLFMDLLGVQRMWQKGGAESVKGRIAEFNKFVIEQIGFLPADLHREGEYTVILSGDSASVICQDFDQAIGIGIHIFTQAFYQSDKVSRPFWLRGAIARWSNQYLTVNTVPIQAKGLQVGAQYVSEDEFLAVLALEKSGFRGMRLIVDRDLLEDEGDSHSRKWPAFKRPLKLVTRLKECTYPDGPGFADVLWMASREDRHEHMKGIMSTRFKRSTGDPDEFTQAAWTRAVFDQVESLIWMCKNYAGHGPEGPEGPA